jgi:hypothetical protein
MKRSIILPCLVTAFVALSPAAAAFADPPTAPGNPSGTGQPNQSAEEQPSEPAGFFSGGFGVAEEHYAGEGDASLTHSHSTHAVSQYDVAAFQFSQTHPSQ